LGSKKYPKEDEFSDKQLGWQLGMAVHNQPTSKTEPTQFGSPTMVGVGQ